MVDKKILKKAIEVASKSDYYVKVGAVIFNGKKIISSGFNEIRYHSKLHPKFKTWHNSLHAEQKAIITSKHNLKRYSILVIRVNNNGEMLLARPCRNCQKYLKYVGIKKVYYSNNNGSITKERI